MSSSTPSCRAKAIKYLTLAQHASAPFINTFVLIHLSAPILASVGGSSLSSQVMLLGREYYQGPLTEPLLVYAPIAVHLTASTIKKLLTGGFLKRPTLLGLSSMPLSILLPIHILSHRILPSTPSPPISALGPSELNYDYVKFGLANWPIRNTLLYLALVGCVATHVIEGSSILIKTYMGSSVSLKLKWDWKRWAVALGAVGSVGAGLWTLKSESLVVPRMLSTRMFEAWSQLWVYRI